MREEGILNDDLRHGIGCMGKFVARAHVARREDSWIRRLQPLAYLDSVLVILNADCFQANSVDIRGSSNADKNLADRHIVLLTMRIDCEPFAPAVFSTVESFPQQSNFTPSRTMRCSTISAASRSSFGKMP